MIRNSDDTQPFSPLSPIYCIPRDEREPRKRAGSLEVRLFPSLQDKKVYILTSSTTIDSAYMHAGRGMRKSDI